MHPIFRNKTWFAAYLILWGALGGMLAALLRIPPSTLGWRDAILIAEPLCVFFAFVCLAPFYVCRHLPLASADRFRLSVYHSGAALLATSLWVGLARAIGYVLELGGRLDP